MAMGKWDNFVTVSCNDSAVIGEIAALPFVRATEKIWVAPSKPAAEDKRDSLANSPLKSENYYGPALRQIEISNGEKLHEAGFKGQGMTIAVIDAGYHNVDKIEAMKTSASWVRKISWNREAISTPKDRTEWPFSPAWR